jgi:O-antigen/teichoic acid export membrane protein
LNKNIIANFFGQFVLALSGLLFTPLYIKYLGVEAYGIVGVFVILTAFVSFFDFGMSQALTRQLAILMSKGGNIKSSANLIRTVECFFLIIGVFVLLVVGLSSGAIVEAWLNVLRLDVNAASTAVATMGFILGCKLLENTYRSCLIGLQRQVSVNLIVSIVAIFRSVGAAFILAYLSPTIDAFFIWQGTVALLSLLWVILFFYKTIPRELRGGSVEFAALKPLTAIATGLFFIQCCSLILSQTDKLAISKLLNLEQLGYYTFASTLAIALYQVVSPISQALFPDMCAAHAAQNSDKFIGIFRKGSQLVVVAAGSVGFFLVCFAEDIVEIWTGDSQLTNRSFKLVMLLVLGNLFSALHYMPFNAYVARGRTNKLVLISAGSVFFYLPLVLVSAIHFGGIGVAVAWGSLTVLTTFVLDQTLFDEFLSDIRFSWYIFDVIVPLSMAFAAAVSLKLLLMRGGAEPNVGELTGAALLIVLVTAMTTDATRKIVFSLTKGFVSIIDRAFGREGK